MSTSEILNTATSVLVIVLLIVSWIAKLRWSNELIKAKDATISALTEQLALSDKFNPPVLHQYMESTRAMLEKHISELKSELDSNKRMAESLQAEIAARDKALNEISGTVKMGVDTIERHAFLIANASHELRTPLNIVLGFGDLLSETQLSAQQKEFVDNIQKGGYALMKVIDDVLDIPVEQIPTEIAKLTEKRRIRR